MAQAPAGRRGRGRSRGDRMVGGCVSTFRPQGRRRGGIAAFMRAPIRARTWSGACARGAPTRGFRRPSSRPARGGGVSTAGGVIADRRAETHGVGRAARRRRAEARRERGAPCRADGGLARARAMSMQVARGASRSYSRARLRSRSSRRSRRSPSTCASRNARWSAAWKKGQIGCAEIAQEERVRTLELRGWMNFAKRGVIVFELGG